MNRKTFHSLTILLGRALLAAALLSVAAVAQDGVSLPADTNLFGGDLPQQNGDSSLGRGAPDTASLAREGYGQTLVFRNGRELRGEVLGIDPEQVVWKRPDASEPLRFPRQEVRRIVTGTEGRGTRTFFQRFFNNRRGNQAKRSDKPPSVTLKLPGGDWLFGKATSADGQTLAVQLDENSQLTVPRASVEWMQFGEAPVPAFGFSGSPLDMEGWLPGNAAMEIVDGTLKVKGSSWLGRNISPPDRFEISFEIPADAEDGLRLWLQPFGPQPNCYGQGTALIRFGRKDIAHTLYINNIASIKERLPKQSLEEEGPVKYRVFYSDEAKRVAVLRNGRQVGDWSFFEIKDPAGNEPPKVDFHFQGFCFDHEDQDDKSLRLNQLRMLPWNGALPKGGETVDDQDRFVDQKGTVTSGRLEALTEKEITFSGGVHPAETGAFIQFPGGPNTVFPDAEAKLDFGAQGEFSVRHLEVHEGKVRCETSFTSALELPLSALQRLIFPLQSSPAAALADVIVFKNGDELPGQVISAGLPGPVRWRTVSGQEVTFASGRIAGLRLAGAATATGGQKAESGVAMVELRSGERLPGKLLALDEKELRLEHARLGPLVLDRSQLWHLFPNPKTNGSEGLLTPGGWKWTDPMAKAENRPPKTIEAAHWVHIDGIYYIRNEGNVSFFDVTSMPGLEHVISPDLERFELRVETTGLAGSPGNFLMTFMGKNSTSLNVTLSYGELQVVVIDPHGRQPNWRQIPLQEKLGGKNTHRAVRCFVDTKAGTCDVVINGVHIVRIGQDKNERLLKGQYTIRIVPYPSQASLLSNIWAGPWSGEIPHSDAESAGATALTNGDVAPGLPKCLREGKLAVDSELGELSFPLEKALALDFGGTLETKRAAARLRLDDGTTVNVDRFHWEGAELSAHSPTLGDLRLPTAATREIIYDPALTRPPQAVLPRALAQKQAKDNRLPSDQ